MAASPADAAIVAEQVLKQAKEKGYEDSVWEAIYHVLQQTPQALQRPAGRTYALLHQAAYWGNSSAATKLVVEFGADPLEKSADGLTPAEVAQGRGHKEFEGVWHRLLLARAQAAQEDLSVAPPAPAAAAPAAEAEAAQPGGQEAPAKHLIAVPPAPVAAAPAAEAAEPGGQEAPPEHLSAAPPAPTAAAPPAAEAAAPGGALEHLSAAPPAPAAAAPPAAEAAAPGGQGAALEHLSAAPPAPTAAPPPAAEVPAAAAPPAAEAAAPGGQGAPLEPLSAAPPAPAAAAPAAEAEQPSGQEAPAEPLSAAPPAPAAAAPAGEAVQPGGQAPLEHLSAGPPAPAAVAPAAKEAPAEPALAAATPAAEAQTPGGQEAPVDPPEVTPPAPAGAVAPAAEVETPAGQEAPVELPKAAPPALVAAAPAAEEAPVELPKAAPPAPAAAAKAAEAAMPEVHEVPAETPEVVPPALAGAAPATEAATPQAHEVPAETPEPPPPAPAAAAPAGEAATPGGPEAAAGTPVATPPAPAAVAPAAEVRRRRLVHRRAPGDKTRHTRLRRVPVDAHEHDNLLEKSLADNIEVEVIGETVQPSAYVCVQALGAPGIAGWVRIAYLHDLQAAATPATPPGGAAAPEAQVAYRRMLHHRRDGDKTTLRLKPKEERGKNFLSAPTGAIMLEADEVVEVMGQAVPANDFVYVRSVVKPRVAGWIRVANLCEEPRCAVADCHRLTWNRKCGEYCTEHLKQAGPEQAKAPTCIAPGCDKPTRDGKVGSYCSQRCHDAWKKATKCAVQWCHMRTWTEEPGWCCDAHKQVFCEIESSHNEAAIAVLAEATRPRTPGEGPNWQPQPQGPGAAAGGAGVVPPNHAPPPGPAKGQDAQGCKDGLAVVAKADAVDAPGVRAVAEASPGVHDIKEPAEEPSPGKKLVAAQQALLFEEVSNHWTPEAHQRLFSPDNCQNVHVVGTPGPVGSPSGADNDAGLPEEGPLPPVLDQHFECQWQEEEPKLVGGIQRSDSDGELQDEAAQIQRRQSSPAPGGAQVGGALRVGGRRQGGSLSPRRVRQLQTEVLRRGPGSNAGARRGSSCDWDLTPVAVGEATPTAGGLREVPLEDRLRREGDVAYEEGKWARRVESACTAAAMVARPMAEFLPPGVGTTLGMLVVVVQTICTGNIADQRLLKHASFANRAVQTLQYAEYCGLKDHPIVQALVKDLGNIIQILQPYFVSDHGRSFWQKMWLAISAKKTLRLVEEMEDSFDKDCGLLRLQLQLALTCQAQAGRVPALVPAM